MTDADYIREHERRAVDEILTSRPFRLPYRLTTEREQCARLGVPVVCDGDPLLMLAKLPPTWTVHRTEHRWITIQDAEGRPMLNAFYKFAPHEERTVLHLTTEARATLRARWTALPPWRRLLEDPAHWAVNEPPRSRFLLWCARAGLLPALYPRQEDPDTIRRARAWRQQTPAPAPDFPTRP
jgi:hypothetical protein